MARNPFLYFECNRNSYLRINNEIKKAPFWRSSRFFIISDKKKIDEPYKRIENETAIFICIGDKAYF